MHLKDLLLLLKASQDTHQGTSYLVGGSVRDGLIGRPFADLDVAVAGDAEAFARRVATSADGVCVPLGERYGTYRVALREQVDGVRFLDCSPVAGDIEEDLARRDFTVNAMAVALPDAIGEDWGAAPVIDPFHGRADLESKTIRVVRPDVLDADPLRLLRAIRLAAELGFRIDPATEAAISVRAPLLSHPAAERVRDELCRVLAAEGAASWLQVMDRTGLLGVVFPELMDGKGVEQPKEHYWDVFDHQMESVAAVEALVDRRVSPRLADRQYLQWAPGGPWHPGLEGYFQASAGAMTRGTRLRLAALLHDVAKPATKSIEPDGRVRFFGHSEQGAAVVLEALGRLRFSRQDTEAVARMVEHHLRPGQLSQGTLPSPRALYRYFRDLGDLSVDTVFLNLGDHLAARGPLMEIADWEGHVHLAGYVLESYFHQQQRARAPRLLTGHDVMESLGLASGPEVGRLLAAVEEARRIGEVGSRDEALEVARLARRNRTNPDRGDDF